MAAVSPAQPVPRMTTSRVALGGVLVSCMVPSIVKARHRPRFPPVGPRFSVCLDVAAPAKSQMPALRCCGRSGRFAVRAAPPYQYTRTLSAVSVAPILPGERSSRHEPRRLGLHRHSSRPGPHRALHPRPRRLHRTAHRLRRRDARPALALGVRQLLPRRPARPRALPHRSARPRADHPCPPLPPPSRTAIHGASRPASSSPARSSPSARVTPQGLWLDAACRPSPSVTASCSSRSASAWSRESAAPQPAPIYTLREWGGLWTG